MSSEYYWYKLFNLKGIGNKSLHLMYNIFNQYGLTIKDIFQLKESEFTKYFNIQEKLKIKYIDLVEIDEVNILNQYNKLKENNIDIVSLENKKYPPHVRLILKEDSPAILFVKGCIQLLNSPSISIVGSRNLEENIIMELVGGISYSLAQNGWNIVSGYAKGVDTKAHLSAIESKGTTSIVLSYGLSNLVVKREFNDLNWRPNTLFVSQFAPYEKFSGYNAMKRNKLVCALSRAVVVISSGPEKDNEGKMSGTFDAGKTALKYGIPLFVLSPKVFDKPMIGNQELIKLGGIEIKNEDDLISKLIEKTDNADNEIMNQLNESNEQKNNILKNGFFQTNLFDSQK